MKKLSLSLAIVLIGLILLGATETFAQKKMKKQPVMWAAENIKWEQMKDAPPGAMVAKLWGDMTKGAYGALVKFPLYHKSPLHTHSSDIRSIVISGTFVGGPEGGPEKSYGSGSYLVVPGGWKHTSGAGDAGCTLFVEQTSKFDMKPVAASMEKK